MRTVSMVASCVLAVSSCGQDGGTAAPTPGYHLDVAPRLARGCLACHATGDDHRPAFSTLAETRVHARRMVEAVEAGTMPPGGLDRSGACGNFQGPLPFTPQDVDILRRWMAAGTPEGPPGPRAATVEQPLPAWDATTTRTIPLSQDDGDVHRCHLVESGERADHLVGVRVEGAAAVHHVMAFSIPAASLEDARHLAAGDGGMGWTCDGQPGIAGANLAVTWVPGAPVAGLPPGTGVPVPSGAVVVQVHQHGVPGGPLSLSLLWASHVERRVSMVPVALSSLSLPPGDDAAAAWGVLPWPGAGRTEVLGVLPHMHAAGRSVTLEIVDGPCLLAAPRFDFQWQVTGLYVEPVPIPQGATFRLQCRYNTVGRASTTHWGESSDDEMCTVFLLVAAPWP